LLEFESRIEPCTLTKLHSIDSDGDSVGETKKIEAKATEDCNNHIFFVNFEGHEDIVCFRNVVEYIIN